MERRMTATEARVHFGEVLRVVADDGETVVVERDGKPRVVVISIDEYRRLTQDRDVRPHWKILLDEAHDQIRREGNLPLIPPPEDVIREGREIRDEEIWDSLR